MNKKFKKALIVLISTFISLHTSCKAANRINDNTSTTPKNLNQINQNEQIYKTSEWKNISSFWKKMNSIDYKQNSSKLIKIYQNIEVEYKSTKENLMQLKEKNYLTQKEYNDLFREINRKYSDIQMNSPMITCYDAVAPDMKQYMLQSDLEKRYKVIEKLFNEGKINTKTFETTRNLIEKDLKELYKLEYPKSNDTIDTKTADLIINLNR